MQDSTVATVTTPAKAAGHQRGQSKVAIFKAFLREYPWQTLTVFVALVLSSLSEGIGILTLLPLLNLTIGEPGGGGAVAGLMAGLFETIGLEATLPAILGVIVVGLLLKAAFRLVAMIHVGYVMAQVATDLRLNLIRSVLSASWRYFVSQPIGRFTNAISAEAGRASSVYMAMCQFMASAVQVLVFLGAAMLMAAELTIAAVAVGALILLVLARFISMARAAGYRQMSLLRSLSATLTDALQGIKPLKAMGQEARLVPLLEEETRGLNKAHRMQVLAKHGLMTLREPVIVVFLAVGVFIALEVADVAMTVLMVMAILFYRAVNGIGALQQHYQAIGASEGFFWSIRRSIETARSHEEPGGGGLQPPSFSRIALDRVSFSYGPKGVLRDVSLELPAGQLTAMIGPSGVGKTTVADLLCGLLQPDSGEVSVDGTPLSGIDIRTWRRQIGYVPQELFLFHDSILSNVALGDPAVSRADAEHALRQAGAWEFVSSLERGMDTVIGERGTRLSGGQRQRISIARALARRPKLLILDEATTALDPKTEAEICATLHDLARDVTIFAISHQPAITGAADRVYRIDGGRVERVE